MLACMIQIVIIWCYFMPVLKKLTKDAFFVQFRDWQILCYETKLMGSEIKKRFQSKSWGVEKYASEIEIKKELYMIIEIWHAYVPFLTQGVGGLIRAHIWYLVQKTSIFWQRRQIFCLTLGQD